MRKVLAIFIALIVFTTVKAQVTECKDSIENILRNAYATDQGLRLDLQKCTNNDEVIEAWRKIQEQDSINQSVVFPIIDKIMAGELEDLSDEAYKACFFVLQHADIDAQLKYYDFVMDSFDKQKLKPIDYMIFVDRVNMYQNKAQIFGSQCAALPNGKIIPYPIVPKAVKDSIAASKGINPKHFALINGAATYSTAEIPDSIIQAKNQNQYDFIEVGENEYAIMGFIFSDPSLSEGVEGAVININGKPMGTSGKYGYFVCKIAKNDVPEHVTITYNGKEIEHEITKEKREGDFVMIIRALR